MTEKEAISRIKDHMEIHRLKEPRAIYITVALSMAIAALKEIQNYRRLGKLEELARAKKYIDLAKKHGTIGEMIDSCAEYEEIGTVEECREAVEKQKPKVPEFTHMLGEYTGKFKCPICEQSFSYDCTDAKVFFCKKCGQALQMESEDD